MSLYHVVKRRSRDRTYQVIKNPDLVVSEYDIINKSNANYCQTHCYNDR